MFVYLRYALSRVTPACLSLLFGSECTPRRATGSISVDVHDEVTSFKRPLQGFVHPHIFFFFHRLSGERNNKNNTTDEGRFINVSFYFLPRQVDITRKIYKRMQF